MKKIILILICLIPILIGVEAYDEAVLAQMGMGFASFIGWIAILIFQKDIKEYKQLSLILFIGKMAGHVIAGGLYLSGHHWDGESAAVIEFIAILAIVGFIVEYVIGYFISRKFKRNLKEK